MAMNNTTKERTSVALDPALRHWLDDLSGLTGFTRSAIVGLALARMRSEPAIFLPINSTTGAVSLPQMSRRSRHAA